MATAERHLASHIFNLAVLVIGGAALAWMIHSVGLANVRHVLADVGWGFAWILGLDIIGMACDAAAIHEFMRPEARMVSFWRVLAAQASGRAINLVTPGGALGEATKVTMLVSYVPRDRVLSSIVLYNLATFYLAVAAVAIGVPITAAVVDLPHRLAVVVWCGLVVVIAVVVGLGVLVHRGAIDSVVSLAGTLRIVSQPRVTAWKARLRDVDRHLRELHTDQSPGTRRGVAWLVVAQLVSWSATVSVLVAVGVSIHAPIVVGVLSIGVLVGWISSIVPLGVGVADGSNYALYGVLGATGAQGVFVTLVGRARSLVLALLGLCVMAIGHAAARVTLARRNRRLRGSSS
jgi:uncharacterized membrane protein YbhN (UPF0104 family)